MSAFARRREAADESWLSVSDLMAGLMVIFLFIAIVYIRPVALKNEQLEDANDELERTKARIEAVTTTWSDVRQRIYDALRAEFADDLPKWDAEIERETLIVRFRAPSVLFGKGNADIRPKFADTLRSFFPRYLKVLARFRGNIEEVRIEGHTSSEWNANTDEREAYFRNMQLSQDRTRAVLEFVLNHDDLYTTQPWARDLLTANGLSSSQLIRTNGREDAGRSRRVEFRVRTDAAASIERIVESLR